MNPVASSSRGLPAERRKGLGEYERSIPRSTDTLA